MTVATTEDIKNKIKAYIGESKKSIKVCVAWFTSKELLGLLTDKAEAKCNVEIIISDHCHNQRLSYKRYINHGGKISVVNTEKNRFLHHKFAIFDNVKIISGSYNWTVSAEANNHENIIISDEESLVNEFNMIFSDCATVANGYNFELIPNQLHTTSKDEESEFLELEAELLNAFRLTVIKARGAGAPINSQLIDTLLNRYGAIGMANNLIGRGVNATQSGFEKLKRIKRLDLTFEHIILEERFRVLFDEKIIQISESRLKSH